MSILNRIWIKLTSKFVAEDKFGNRYYESSSKDYLGRKSRYVLYKGSSEPSKVPPIYHAWLHHLKDSLEENDTPFVWQKDYKQNLTGTNMAYSPIKKGTKRDRVSSDYQPFQPNKEVS